MQGYELPKQLDSIPSNVATLILQTPCSQLGSGLAAFGKFLLQIAELDINLDDPASTIRVNVEESFLENVEKAIDLGFGVFGPFLLLAKV